MVKVLSMSKPNRLNNTSRRFCPAVPPEIAEQQPTWIVVALSLAWLLAVSGPLLAAGRAGDEDMSTPTTISVEAAKTITADLADTGLIKKPRTCLLYTYPSPRDKRKFRNQS